MRKRGIIKYFILFFLCFFILLYGFIMVNIHKPKLVREKSKFTIDLKLKPFDFRIDTKDYVFYVNSKVIDNMKEQCTQVYNGIFSK